MTYPREMLAISSAPKSPEVDFRNSSLRRRSVRLTHMDKRRLLPIEPSPMKVGWEILSIYKELSVLVPLQGTGAAAECQEIPDYYKHPSPRCIPKVQLMSNTFLTVISKSQHCA